MQYITLIWSTNFRKRVFSLNAQVTSTFEGQITSFNATYPGATHDARIFRNSGLSELVNRPESTDAILADSGYGLTHRVLTPNTTPTTDAQQRYTAAQIRGRNSIERLFGVLKNRSGILGKKLRFSPEKASRIFACCCIIHNFLKFCDDAERDLGVQLDNDVPDELPDTDGLTPLQYRDLIADHYFAV